MYNIKECKRLTENILKEVMEEISKKGIKHEFVFIVYKDNWYNTSIDKEVLKLLKEKE